MAVELKPRGVVSVSLWPGPVHTELVSEFLVQEDTGHSKVKSSLTSKFVDCSFFSVLPDITCLLVCTQLKEVFVNGESTEMSGKCIVRLAEGRILLSTFVLMNDSAASAHLYLFSKLNVT